MWTINPRQGNSVPIVYSFGKIALSSADDNWYMTWLEN